MYRLQGLQCVLGRSNATWVVSENHRAAHAAFREPLARSKANPSNCRRFR
jgi:hypothetical protein